MSMGAGGLVPQSQRAGSGGTNCSGSAGVRRFLLMTSPSVEVGTDVRPDGLGDGIPADGDVAMGAAGERFAVAAQGRLLRWQASRQPIIVLPSISTSLEQAASCHQENSGATSTAVIQLCVSVLPMTLAWLALMMMPRERL